MITMNKMSGFARKNSIEKVMWNIVKIAVLCVIAYTIYVSFHMNRVGRSMWLDEASLLWAFLTRHIWELTAEPLEYMQSAPVLYLYTVKVFQILFGSSEFVFRLPSFIAYCGLILLTYLFLKKSEIKLSLAGCAMVAALSVLMKYASELKQYMFEACLVMGILYLYSCYLRRTDQKTKFWYAFAITGALGIWGGNPCCFVLGGILTIEFLGSFFRKNVTRMKETVIAGIIIMASFFLYYLYWLKPVIDAGGMTSYWEGNRFPLLFWINQENRDLAKKLVDSYLKYFNKCTYIVGVLVLAAMVLGFIVKKKEIMAITVGFLITIIASSLGFFPIQDRICLFFYPVIIVLLVFLLNVIIESGKAEGIVISISICLLIFVQSQGIVRYREIGNIMKAGEEINGLIDYAQDNVGDSKVYLYADARVVFQYKTGVGNHSIGTGTDNVIYGKGFFGNGWNREEIEYLKDNPGTYLMLFHAYRWNSRFFPLFKELTDSGYLYLVKREYETPLYFYSDDVLGENISAEIEFVDSYEKEGLDTVKIRIRNTGTYYVGNGYNELYLGTSDGRVKTAVPKQLEPGEAYDVEVSLKRCRRDEAVEINLYLEDQYSFETLGTAGLSLHYEDAKWYANGS